MLLASGNGRRSDTLAFRVDAADSARATNGHWRERLVGRFSVAAGNVHAAIQGNGYLSQVWSGEQLLTRHLHGVWIWFRAPSAEVMLLNRSLFALVSRVSLAVSRVSSRVAGVSLAVCRLCVVYVSDFNKKKCARMRKGVFLLRQQRELRSSWLSGQELCAEGNILL